MTIPNVRTPLRIAGQCAHAIPRLALYGAIGALAHAEDALVAFRHRILEEHVTYGTRTFDVIDTILDAAERAVHEAWLRTGLAWEALLPAPQPGYWRLFAMITAQRAAGQDQSSEDIR